MGWFIYDNGLRHERVNKLLIPNEEMQVCLVERNIYLSDKTKISGSFLLDPTQGNIHGLTL